MYPRIDINLALVRRIKNVRHPWIFSGAIIKTEYEKSKLHGQLVSVFGGGEFLFNGTFNAKAQIAVRAYTWEQRTIDKTFFLEKISTALQLRKDIVLDQHTTAARVIFAEADFLPGFIVDKYNNSYILQIHTYGAEQLKMTFVEALAELTQAEMILEKSDSPSRKHEGMEKKHEELLYGIYTSSEQIKEHGMNFHVSFEGQKTGFFLDQREARLLIKELCAKQKERHTRVLNLFSYTGGFSVAALLGGAQHVTSVDISADAISEVTTNMSLNSLEETAHSEHATDAFAFLKTVKHDEYSIIILDPPAFVKAKKDIGQGMKGYLSINQLALEKLPKNGLLLTCSCSGLVDEKEFIQMLTWASTAAGCQVQILNVMSHAADHPILPNYPEGRYLKTVLLRKI